MWLSVAVTDSKKCVTGEQGTGKDDSLQIFDTTIVHIVVRVHTVREQEKERKRGT